MVGLARSDAATASLLLTLEGAATALMAWFIFHENFDRRIVVGMVWLAAGAAVLAWSGAPTLRNALGPLAIVAACVAWGLDNNLTRKVSLADPLQIVGAEGVDCRSGERCARTGGGRGAARFEINPCRGRRRFPRLWR
jgi:drug/metabolite transporter (DMT)-like permease